MGVSFETIENILKCIEEEMKLTGLWEMPEPTTHEIERMGAFGEGSIAFEQWIRFILFPNVKALITDNGAFPTNSQVGIYATRYYDGVPGREQLVQLLSEFDNLGKPKKPIIYL